MSVIPTGPIFLAHRKGIPEDVLELQRQQLLIMLAAAKAHGVDVVLGLEDAADETFGIAAWQGQNGNPWDLWIQSVIERYSTFVIPDFIVGRATAGMIEGALKKGAVVLYWNEEDSSTFALVEGVDLIGADARGKTSWVTYARLRLRGKRVPKGVQAPADWPDDGAPGGEDDFNGEDDPAGP